MDQIVQIINNKEYILFEMPVITKTAEKFDEMCKNVEAIQVAINVKSAGVWPFKETYFQIKVLVPADKATEFSKGV